MTTAAPAAVLPPTFGTGTLSRLLGIAPRTISKMFDSGTLQGFRTEGGDRRVTLESLRAFIADRKLPYTDAHILAAAYNNRETSLDNYLRAMRPDKVEGRVYEWSPTDEAPGVRVETTEQDTLFDVILCEATGRVISTGIRDSSDVRLLLLALHKGVYDES